MRFILKCSTQYTITHQTILVYVINIHINNLLNVCHLTFIVHIIWRQNIPNVWTRSKCSFIVGMIFKVFL